MSGVNWLAPPPSVLGNLCVGDIDSRYYDFGPDLRLISDPIAMIAGIVVTRVDGSPVGEGDLAITPSGKAPPWLDTSGYVVNWWESAPQLVAPLNATGGVTYMLTVTVITSFGRTLNRDVVQTVSPVLG